MIVGYLLRHRTWHVGRRRVHHGRVGELLCVIGLALMLDDFADRWWSWDR